MATIRQRGTKYQVQIRRNGQRQLTKTFNLRRDAIAWARQMEVQADRNDLPMDGSILKQLTLRVRGIPREREGKDLVFPTTANAVRLSWQRITKAAGIEDLHFHDLRHEAISRFFELGLTVPEVASISGHRDARMLLRYAHAQTKVVQEKLSRFG